MKISVKLFLGLLLLVVLMVADNIFSIRSFEEVHQNFDQLNDDIIPGIFSMNNIISSVNDLQLLLSHSILSRGQEEELYLELESVIEQLKKRNLEHLKYEAHHVGAEERGAAVQLNQKVDKVIVLSNKIVELKKRGVSVDELLKMDAEELNPAIQEMTGHLKEHEKMHMKEMLKSTEIIHKAHVSVIKSILWGGGLSLIIAVLVSLWIANSIIKPFNILYKGVEEIGKGNLDHKVLINSKNEFGKLSSAINKMAGSLKETTVSLVSLEKEIEKRKQIEQELRLSKEKAELLLRLVPSAVFTVDKDIHVSSWNDKAAELTGYTADEIIGKECHIFSESPCKEKCGLFSDDVSKPIFNKECTIRKQNGEIRIISKNVDYLRDKEGEIIGGIESFEDITDRKEAEKQTEEVMRMKMSFISQISHELRTPLTALKESIAIVYDGICGTVNDEQKDFLDTAKRNLERLTRLINTVFDIQRLQSGIVKFNMQDNDINEAAEEVYRTMYPLITKKGIELLFSRDNNLPLIRFDRDKIIQVLTNIVNNANKFTDTGSIKIMIQRKGDNIVQVSVQDMGCGIKESDIKKLFTPFEQLEIDVSKKVGGAGLGLVICKEIIVRHKGKIWIDSVFGQGTTVSFILPIIERRGYV